MIWRRGCIYYSTLPDVPEDYKSVLVVSPDWLSEVMKPIVVQVTSSRRVRTADTHVELRPGEGGVDRLSFVLCHQLVTIDPDAIEQTPLGPPISPRKMVEVNHALAVALDLPESWPAAGASPAGDH